MSIYRVNADYEQQLFTGKAGPLVINESLEFVFFFLSKDKLLTTKKYHPDYLDYVGEVTGISPVLVSSGVPENYWGALKDCEKERWWNSKLTTTEFIQQMGWCHLTGLGLPQEQHLEIWQGKWLLKDPYGMSGMNFMIFPDLHVSRKSMDFSRFVREPLLDRKFDFSHYIFESGEEICYQNLVDHKFQYKGTLLRDMNHPKLQQLEFFQQIPELKWQRFYQQYELIKGYFSRYPNEYGYSVDSFVYELNGLMEIRPLSEINYRRTMGRITYELGKMYGEGRPWIELRLIPNKAKSTPLWKSGRDFTKQKRCLVLSPGDTRFEMILITAENKSERDKLMEEINSLLPNA